MDDGNWQDAALSSRHLHHRGTTSRHHRPSAFHPRNLLGTYNLTCAAASKLASSPALPQGEDGQRDKKKKKKNDKRGRVKSKHRSQQPDGSAALTLDIYRLVDSQDGFLGQMCFPGVGEMNVVLAGSRKVMSKILTSLSESGEADVNTQDDSKRGKGDVEDNPRVKGEDEELQGQSESGDVEKSDSEEEEEEDDDDEEGEEDIPNTNFEKNTFRNPKFWLQFQPASSPPPESQVQPDDAADIFTTANYPLWQQRAETTSSSSTMDGGDHGATGDDQSSKEGIGGGDKILVRGWGYLVFSNNECKRFKGTFTCETWQWDNVPVTGHKTVTLGERDLNVQWDSL